MKMDRPGADFIGWATAYGAVLVSALLAARYGVKVADTNIDAWLRGASLFIIAVVGCHGFAWGVRTWRGGSRGLGFFIAAGSLVCFAVTLAGGLGTVASGTDHTQAERSKSIDDTKQDRSDRDRALADKEKLPPYTPTTQAGVDAAEALVTSASETRGKECSPERGGRGDNCRKREDAEAEARKAYTRAVADKATTDAAAALDAKIAVIDGRQKDAGATAKTADPQAAFIVRLANRAGIGISDDEAAAFYAFGVSLAMELAAMIALVSAEINSGRVAPAAAPAPAPAPQAPEIRAPAPMAAPRAPAAAAAPATPPARPPAAKPQELKAAAIGDVAEYALARLRLSSNDKAGLREVYADYRSWCLGEDYQPLPSDRFVAQFQRYCQKRPIAIRPSADGVYCYGVRIAA